MTDRMTNKQSQTDKLGGQTDLDGRTDRQVDRQTDKQTTERTRGQTNRRGGGTVKQTD